MRTAHRDVEIAGERIAAGEMAILLLGGANRDPSVFAQPNRFDITREGLPPVLNFGAGVHYCLGANLARREIAEALKTVTRRIANPRKNGPAPWKPIVGLSGPASLPIAFDSLRPLTQAGEPLRPI